jgi:PPM family protein phosphatase
MSSQSQPAQQVESESGGKMELAVRGVTDQGRVRKNNEDNLAACDLSTGQIFAGPFELQRAVGPSGILLLVADGMGGQACGELASRMCSEIVPAWLLERVKERGAVGHDELGKLLAEALESANQSVLEASRGEPACQGMGTTATAVWVNVSSVLVAQVGDSRAYLIREGQMTQLTRDQTFLNYLVDMGAVEASTEARDDPRRSILVQALGTSEHLNVVLSGAELQSGDRLLIASDGLYGAVGGDRIREIAGGQADLERRCRLLIDTANREGGPDNITLILADISGLPETAHAAPLRVEAVVPKG